MVTKPFFAICLFLHGVAALYYVWRFRHELRPISLVGCSLSFGWSLAYAHQLQLIPIWLTNWSLYLGFFSGVLHLMAILSIERQRR